MSSQSHPQQNAPRRIQLPRVAHGANANLQIASSCLAFQHAKLSHSAAQHDWHARKHPALQQLKQRAQKVTAGVPGDTRPLQGQPEYVLNAGLNYDKPEHRFYAGLFFNVSGPLLYAAGGGTSQADFVPDAYAQPFPALDFNITQGITEEWKMTLRGKNLLNPFYRITTTYNGVDYDTLSFTKGWDVSLNVSYGF